MNAPAQSLPPQASSAAMIRTLAGIAMLSGFLVVLVFEATAPRIAENKRRAIEQAVFEVLPGAVTRRDFILGAQGLQPAAEAEADGLHLYAGYDAQGKLLGVAAEAAARGYQDVIRLLYGYDPACQCITGISVIQMTETPGLGDKIAKDPDFQKNFETLEARLDSAGQALANPIVTVKSGTKSAPWQIDAISGATISSVAVGKALNTSTQQLLPRLQPQVAALQQKEAP